MTDEQLKEKCKDSKWRVRNLYYIKDKNGKRIKYSPNIFQEIILSTGWYFNVILKSRQLGITTFYAILYLDQVLFRNNRSAGVIAHTEKDAKKIFKDKIRFAFDNLSPRVKRLHNIELITETTEELGFANGSNIFVSVSTRASTVQYLHISEFGWTCLKFPEKAEEIITGALNSVEQGNYVSIESTAHTREGRFYEICDTARKLRAQQVELSKLEFKFFFFPWFMNPDYKMEANITIPQRLVDYFNELELKEGITLSEEQRKWYAVKEATLREAMYQEYPSTADEAFQSAIQGAFYAKEMMQLVASKRLTKVYYDKRLSVDTWWDLGMNDYNVILFTQQLGQEIRFIDMFVCSGEGLPYIVKVLKDKEYTYGTHHLPHDVMVRELGTGKSRYEVLMDLKVNNIEVQSKDVGLLDGIELTRLLFNRFWIDDQKCEQLSNAVINYRREWDDRLGQFKSQPLHDSNSHVCDALRLVGVMLRDVYLNQEDEQVTAIKDKLRMFPSVI